MAKLSVPLLIVFILMAYPVNAAQSVFTFGFVPQQSAAVLVKKWGPILRYVSKKISHKIAFRTAPNIPTFEQRVREGQYDFAYMNPAHYTVFAKDPGYRAFAKQKGKRIKGILVVRKDSPIKKLAELTGKPLAFPAPAAFAASVLQRSYLSQQGIAITPKYVGSHDSVYHGVVKGLYPAGGGIQRTFGTVTPKIGEQLRVLWTTNGYTPHAFAAHPRISAEVVTSVQRILSKMFDDPAGRKLLQVIGFKKGAVSARDSDWDDVRKLGITKLPK